MQQVFLSYKYVEGFCDINIQEAVAIVMYNFFFLINENGKNYKPYQQV